MSRIPEETFVYDRLQPGDIRLLKLTGVDHRQRICCELSVTRKSEGPDYVALSYAWGAPEKTQTIICNGLALRITQNLHEMLLELVYSDNPPGPFIWADAICLNQEDDAERSHEVLRMDGIYSSARAVVIWLGPAAYHSNYAMRMIHHFAEVDGDPAHLPVQTDKLWPAFNQLLERAWFERVWCFQEAVLARKSIFRCGGREIDSNTLLKFLDLSCHRTRRLWLELVSRPDAGLKVFAIFRARYDRYGPYGRPMHEESIKPSRMSALLDYADCRQCSDFRDKVFGILSLGAPDVRAGISVSYNISAEDLFIQTAKIALEETVDGINYLSIMKGRERNRRLPTWCVDLRARKSYFYPIGNRARPPFWRERAHAVEVSLQHKYMRFLAYEVDTIDLSIAATPFSSPRGHKRLARWLYDCQELAQNTLNGSLEDVYEVYVRVLRCLTASEDGSPRSIVVEYDRWLQTRGFRSLLLAGTSFENNQSIPFDSEVLAEVENDVIGYAKGRAYFSTNKHRLGLGPRELQPRDTMVVIPGAKAPHVLRKCQHRNAYEYVGEAYGHGLMEPDKVSDDELAELKEFIVV